MKPVTNRKSTTNSRPERFGLLREVTGAVVITVSVVSRSSQSIVVGVREDALKIKLNKPPVEGRANSECCTVIARFLGVPKSQVRVIRGLKSRRKEVLVEGVPHKQIADRLLGR